MLGRGGRLRRQHPEGAAVDQGRAGHGHAGLVLGPGVGQGAVERLRGVPPPAACGAAPPRDPARASRPAQGARAVAQRDHRRRLRVVPTSPPRPPMLRTLSLRLAAVATIVASVVAPSALNAQKALVYCPVGIDAGGCTTIVAALNADATRFPDGADAGYDGTQGTLDLATTDFSSYAVFVVPSLADGPDAQPYALLRNGTIAARLQAAFMGRAAVWSGTPDVGTTNRSSKDALIRNLAAWATSDAAGTHGPGVVALQDNSDDESARYGWLSAISAMTVGADTTFDVYSNVQVLTSTGQAILTSGGLQLGYTNMASYGLVASGASQDATGARTSRVVLVTVAGDPSDPNLAAVNTDKDDYQPGDTVTVTGTGWEPGETVSLLFHEDVDPPIHPDKTFTAVADADGRIVNRDYVIDEEDLNVRF